MGWGYIKLKKGSSSPSKFVDFNLTIWLKGSYSHKLKNIKISCFYLFLVFTKKLTNWKMLWKDKTVQFVSLYLKTFVFQLSIKSISPKLIVLTWHQHQRTKWFRNLLRNNGAVSLIFTAFGFLRPLGANNPRLCILEVFEIANHR